MHWVCYIEIQGLYAEAARAAGLAAPEQPVAVLRGGAVFDGCQRAFTAGLTLGAPARQALRDAPEAIRIDLEQVDARPRARRLWEECLAHTPYIEPLEPHQLFLALPAPGQSLGAAVKAEVRRLQEAAEALGFAAFAGTAANRLVARAAALSCKEGWLLRRPGAAPQRRPERAAFAAPGQEESFLAPLPIRYLPAPPEVQRRLARLGLQTIGEAARIPESEWLRQLGPLGRQVALWSRGADEGQVRACYPPRSLAERIQFQPEVGQTDLLEAALSRMAVTLSRRLAQAGEGCQQVALVLEQAAGPPLRATRTLSKLQQDPYPLQQAVCTLLGGLLRGEAAITAAAVEAGLIGPMPFRQLDLWEDQARRERDERLKRALTLLHERFPVRVIGLGQGSEVSWREQMLGFNDPYRAGRRLEVPDRAGGQADPHQAGTQAAGLT